MCGRYVSARTEPDLIGEFECARSEVARPLTERYNVAPTDLVPVVRLAGDGARVLRVARWGLVPSWAGDASIGSRLFNARVETVVDKPAFRAAVRERRCLLPADGWYEWAADGAGRRRPHLLRAAGGGGVALAGLFETWRAPGGEILETVTIVTTAAVGPAAAVHDRMPVVVPRALWSAWLAPGSAVEPLLASVLGAVPEIAVSPAHPSVGDVRVDGPHLLAAPPYDEELTLF